MAQVSSRRAGAAAAVLPVLLLLAHADAQPPQDAAMPQPVATVVEGDQVKLEAAFAHDVDARRIEVRYRLENTGAAPLAVFDRGDRHAVMSRRLRPGAVPAPLFEQDGDALTLRHAALALRTPSPTVPPTPLAAKLAPGAQLEGRFAFDLALAASPPRRARWCLGTAPFDDADFSQPEAVDGLELWRASFAVVPRQRLLCTPWFDLAAGRFAAEDRS